VTELITRRTGADCVRIAMPAQPREIIYLFSKPGETPGRKVTGLNAERPGRVRRRTLAGPPDGIISPLGKPGETLGRKAKGTKANEGPSVMRTGRENFGRKVSPAAGEYICLANQEKFWDAKLWGLKREAPESFAVKQAALPRSIAAGPRGTDNRKATRGQGAMFARPPEYFASANMQRKEFVS